MLPYPGMRQEYECKIKLLNIYILLKFRCDMQVFTKSLDGENSGLQTTDRAECSPQCGNSAQISGLQEHFIQCSEDDIESLCNPLQRQTVPLGSHTVRQSGWVLRLIFLSWQSQRILRYQGGLNDDHPWLSSGVRHLWSSLSPESAPSLVGVALVVNRRY